MRAELRGCVRWAAICLLAAGMVSGPALSLVRAAGDYEIDIKGTLQIIKPSKSGEPVVLTGEPDVTYRIIFQYRDPSSEGVSFLDRAAQVTDGQFEIQGLRGDKVYRVNVERVIFDESLPGGRKVEIVPLSIPPDLFLETPAAPDSATPPAPVEIELALAGAARTGEEGQALLFQYNGKEVRLATMTVAPPVS